MRSRWLPQPLMSLTLLVTWLLVNNSLATWFFGTLLAVLLPLFTARFWPEAPRRVRLLPLARFAPIFLWDVVVANLRVALLILGPPGRLRPGFVVVPLDLRQPFPITLLASVISLTPGTVSANLAGDGRSLLVHGLDVDDPEATVRQIKQRYERRIQEIFE